MPLENRHDGKEKQYPEKLRHAIDEGKASDKVAVPDPAAVSLGTDSEAGGHTPTSEEVEMAIKEETKPVSPKAQGPGQSDRSYYAEARPCPECAWPDLRVFATWRR